MQGIADAIDCATASLDVRGDGSHTVMVVNWADLGCKPRETYRG